MAIEVTGFREFKKGSLLGFTTLRMTNIGLEIRDCTVHSKDGKKWVGLPSKPYDDKDGNTKYSYIVHFYSDEVWRKFQNAAMAALEPHLKKIETTLVSVGDNNDIPF